MSATLQSERSHFCKKKAFVPWREKPFTCYRCHSCRRGEDYHRDSMRLPWAPEPVSVTDRQPCCCCWLRAFKTPDSEGHEMFCRVENEPPRFIKGCRRATRGKPSVCKSFVCAGKISPTPSSICHICPNLLFSAVNCSNLALCCSCSASTCLICICLREKKKLCCVSQNVFHDSQHQREEAQTSAPLSWH